MGLLSFMRRYKDGRKKICFNKKRRSMTIKTNKRIIELLELLAGSVLPTIFWISLIFGFDAPYVAILTIISAVIHELGHHALIAYYTKEIAEMRGHASGFRIKRKDRLSYGKEIVILLAGPLANTVLFLMMLPLGNSFEGYARIFGYINLATGLSNLLPFEGYDGYEAARNALGYFGKEDMIRHLESFSFILGVGVTFVSLHLIDKFSEGYWIFGLFFLATLSKLVKYGKYDIFEQ
jgi:hypothetical protein